MIKDDLKCCGNCTYYIDKRMNSYCSLNGCNSYSYNFCNDWKFDNKKNILRDITKIIKK